MEFARAYVDSFAQSSDELTRRIGIVEEAMPKMMDYIRREVSTNVYDGINKSGSTSDGEILLPAEPFL
jgi:hypothetical protein